MNSRLTRARSVFLLVVAAVTLGVVGSGLFPPAETARAADEGKANAEAARYTQDGQLKQPIGYREWVYVGTPLTPNDMNDGEAAFPEFHSVYMDRKSWEHYKKTGEYRDGTTLVKELLSVGTKEAESGKGYFMGKFTGLEVSVKDSKRFADEPGKWAYFSFGHKYPLKKTAKAAPAASCNSCHEASADDDWVFTQYYPVLQAAKPKR
jgi:hypothetical protein